jgi:hypothetical protein
MQPRREDLRTALLVALVAALPLLACGTDEDHRTIISPPAPALPTVECCDFEDRKDCQDVRAALLDKKGWLLKHGVCFEHGRCLTDCPEGPRR